MQKIEIHLSNSNDAYPFLNDIPDEIKVDMPLIKGFKGGNIELPITFFVTFAFGVSSSLVAAWLYDKFKKCRNSKITIDRKEITIDEGSITRIIEEKIKYEQ